MTHALGRREFLGGLAAAGVFATGSRPLAAYPYDGPLAFQLHALRFLAAKDFPGTLKTVAAFGYKVVEIVSFPGYSANTQGRL